MNVRTRFLRKTNHIKLTQLGNLLANNLSIINPDRAAKFRRQCQQVLRIQRGVGVIEWAWHGGSGNISFFYITPHREVKKKYRFLWSLCKTDMETGERYALNNLTPYRNFPRGDDSRQSD
ncbi:hypothetical protein D3C75_939600 [compost metagenome]